MSTYYCHDCARALGHLSSMYTSSLTGSSYQWDKYRKHTMPTPQSQYASVFDNPSTQGYQSYVVNSAASGGVEFDDLGRRNIYWYAGREIGVLWMDGIPEAPTDTVKLVLSSETQRIHAMSVNSQHLSTAFCASCGKHVLI